MIYKLTNLFIDSDASANFETATINKKQADANQMQIHMKLAEAQQKQAQKKSPILSSSPSDATANPPCPRSKHPGQKRTLPWMNSQDEDVADQPETAGRAKQRKLGKQGKQRKQKCNGKKAAPEELPVAKRTHVGRPRKPSQTILENNKVNEELKIIKAQKSSKITVKKAQKAAQSQVRHQLDKILPE